MKTDLGTIRSMFKANDDILQRTLNGVPDSEWLTTAGKDTNHLLWIAGHMVVSRAVVPRLLGKSWSAPWEKLFARGAERVASDQYPTPAEIRKAWTDVSQELADALANASPETLAKPPAQGAPSLDGTIAGTVGFLCLHETYHLGQLGYLHKWLGYGKSVG